MRKGRDYKSIYPAHNPYHLARKAGAQGDKLCDLTVKVDNHPTLAVDFCIGRTCKTNSKAARTKPGVLAKHLEDTKWRNLRNRYVVKEMHKDVVHMTGWLSTGGITAATANLIDRYAFKWVAANRRAETYVGEPTDERETYVGEPKDERVALAPLAAKYKAMTARVVRSGACSQRMMYRERLLELAEAHGAAPIQELVRFRVA